MGVCGLEAGLTDGGYGMEGGLELHHLARRDTPGGYLRHDALQVANALQLVVDSKTEVWVAEEVVYDVESAVDLPLVLQGEYEPAAQQSSAHRTDGAVDDVEEALAVFLHRIDKLQGAYGELVEAHVALFLDARDAGDMSYLRMQCLFQVLQDGPRSDDPTLQVVDAKSLERTDVEVLVELLMGRLLGKHPVVEFEGAEPCTEIALEVVLAPTVVEHLLGLEVANELLHVVVGTLATQELARRDVEEADATGSLAEMNGTEEVVLLIVQHGVLHGHTRCHQFGDATLDELLGQLGVFQLVADGHAPASPDELGQISVEGMMRKTRHLVALVISIVAMCQCDAQYLCSHYGIVAIGLIEIAATKQQQRLRVFRLEVEKLFHHRCELITIPFCHKNNILPAKVVIFLE